MKKKIRAKIKAFVLEPENITRTMHKIDVFSKLAVFLKDYIDIMI